MTSLAELFEHRPKDNAEKKIQKTMPKMAKEATSSDLKAGFEKHLEETEGQIVGLDEVFDLIGKLAKGKKCSAPKDARKLLAEILAQEEATDPFEK